MRLGWLFRDRLDAGAQLGEALRERGELTPVVLGLPRGGVPVAAEVARALDAPLDVLVVRKLGVPSHPELAMGAVGECGVRVLDETVVRRSRVSPGQLAAVERTERAEVERRSDRLRRGRTALALTGRTALVVDDGLATGATARAACHVARALGAARVVVTAPVGAPDAVERLRADADDVVCLQAPDAFSAVGQWYADFRPTTDEEVERLLAALRP